MDNNTAMNIANSLAMIVNDLRNQTAQLRRIADAVEQLKQVQQAKG
jgi:hypothetical protein